MRTGTSGRRRAQCSTNSLHRTVDTSAGIWIIVLSCSSRGVVMGRREDGAAVGTRPEMRPDPTGSMTGEIPPSIDAAPRALEQRTPKRSGDGGAPLAGITTCRQELADRRGWSTFSKARPAHRKNAASGAPEGAFLRFATEERDASQDVPPGVFRRPPTGGLASPSACRRSAPLVGRRELQFAKRACPGPTQRTRAMTRARTHLSNVHQLRHVARTRPTAVAIQAASATHTMPSEMRCSGG